MVGWTAPTATGPISGTVELPGSKSLTNRALVLAALADSPSTLRGALRSRDTDLMSAALVALGTEISSDGDAVEVQPRALSGPVAIECGLAGTVMRFVPPVAVLADGPVDFDGDPYARKRPMGAVLQALRDLGADVTPDATALPFTVSGHGGLRGGVVELDASASSQFVSALLLAGARYDEGVDVRHTGKPVPSMPHIEMTVAELRRRGVTVDDGEPDRWRVHPGPIAGVDVTIEPDLSNAAPFLAAAVVTGGRVSVPNWPQRTTQPGAALVELLAAYGADCAPGTDRLTVTGPPAVEPVDLDLHDVGELTPVLAALAACARGRSHLRGVGHLRGHETDRLAALAGDLRACGAEVTETEDGLEIVGADLYGAVWACHADHRMAQAGAVIGLRVPGVELDDVHTTAKTLPEFVGLWDRLVGGR